MPLFALGGVLFAVKISLANPNWTDEIAIQCTELRVRAIIQESTFKSRAKLFVLYCFAPRLASPRLPSPLICYCFPPIQPAQYLYHSKISQRANKQVLEQQISVLFS
uniref:Secreted protein n=1 Tax=Caenorhabditis japonica TaxID=281687 RepID=A0A8R1EGB7_CAEJA